MELIMISFKPALRLDVSLARPLDVQETPNGYRRVIPITGGHFSGERVKGQILPGGADWNLVRHDGIVHLWARYTLQTDDGVLISILNEGFQRGPADTMAKILSGKPIDASQWYSRTTPRFEVAGEKYQWLNQTVFIGDLLPPTRPDRVSIEVFEVL
jgi:hypothetical protein